MKILYDKLIKKEKILHSETNRKNADIVVNLLHDDFIEICRSGVSVNKMETINSLTLENCRINIYSENYHCSYLNNDTVLLTYISYQLENKKKIKITYRSSIWIKNKEHHWQLRFHQGTAKNDT
ncbi:DUF4440 domain-containing protein [Proteus hauseri]|uniref:nuclear transport factor 2 family protein n=1 Tax=Proteus hauseri TaxID=183417 RepID=UPI00100963C5|nr:DUF4440 domain-containing protein [Proteus hauseri]QAV25097.1 ribonuclease H [Proteus hauseri]